MPILPFSRRRHARVRPYLVALEARRAADDVLHRVFAGLHALEAGA